MFNLLLGWNKRDSNKIDVEWISHPGIIWLFFPHHHHHKAVQDQPFPPLFSSSYSPISSFIGCSRHPAAGGWNFLFPQFSIHIIIIIIIIAIVTNQADLLAATPGDEWLELWEKQRKSIRKYLRWLIGMHNDEQSKLINAKTLGKTAMNFEGTHFVFTKYNGRYSRYYWSMAYLAPFSPTQTLFTLFAHSGQIYIYLRAHLDLNNHI